MLENTSFIGGKHKELFAENLSQLLKFKYALPVLDGQDAFKSISIINAIYKSIKENHEIKLEEL